MYKTVVLVAIMAVTIVLLLQKNGLKSLWYGADKTYSYLHTSLAYVPPPKGYYLAKVDTLRIVTGDRQGITVINHYLKIR